MQTSSPGGRDSQPMVESCDCYCHRDNSCKRAVYDTDSLRLELSIQMQRNSRVICVDSMLLVRRGRWY